MTIKRYNMKQEPIILIGGGGHCKSCIDVIEQEGRYRIAGIIDVPDKVGQKVMGYPVIGSDNQIPELAKKVANFIITIGQIYSAEPRIKLFAQLQTMDVEIPVIISPYAYVSKDTKIGKGTIVFHGSIINSGVEIGNNCIVNSGALIEHDSKIGNHCHISTGAIINGCVTVGDETFFGSGAVSRESVQIPRGSFIKANSLVK